MRAESPPEGNEMLSIKEQDLILPIANITRLMKSVLPYQSKLAADAKVSMQECVSEFVLFITQEAAENAVNSNKKTISGDGIIPAFTSLGMRNYALVLNAFLGRYREKYLTHKAEAGEGGEGGEFKMEGENGEFKMDSDGNEQFKNESDGGDQFKQESEENYGTLGLAPGSLDPDGNSGGPNGGSVVV